MTPVPRHILHGTTLASASSLWFIGGFLSSIPEQSHLTQHKGQAVVF